MLESLKQIPLDPLFKLLYEYLDDKNPRKINLGIGLYYDKNGNPFVFPSVKKAFSEIDKDNFNYQAIGGNKEFLNLTADFVFNSEINTDNLAMQASCGGTQACRLFSDLIFKDQGSTELLIGTPSWGNHFAVFKSLNPVKFKHLDADGNVNFEAYKNAVNSAKIKPVLLLQGGQTHNPTGKSLSIKQLEELVPLINEKEIRVFMDSAYLGLGEGILEDKKYIQFSYNQIDNFAFAVSFSKNASLYEHRTGALFIKTNKKETIESQMQQLARESISMSPGIGQEIMINIFKNHKENWLNELEEARKNINNRRKTLLEKLGPKFDYLQESKGMFGLLQFSVEKIRKIKEEFSIYLPENGRINFAGIKPKDIDYIAESFLL